jgi:hypothetical protein
MTKYIRNYDFLSEYEVESLFCRMAFWWSACATLNVTMREKACWLDIYLLHFIQLNNSVSNTINHFLYCGAYVLIVTFTCRPPILLYHTFITKWYLKMVLHVPIYLQEYVENLIHFLLTSGRKSCQAKFKTQPIKVLTPVFFAHKPPSATCLYTTTLQPR